MTALQDTIYFAIFLGVLVTVHEAGHFVFAKLCGVRVVKFSIGFGPKVFSFHRGETEYQLAALPLGGFVAMAGQNPGDEVNAVDSGRTFLGAPWYQRFLIVGGGPLFNLVFPVFAFFFAFLGTHSAIAPKVRWVEPNFPAAAAGIKAGDTVLRVGTTPIRSFDEIRSALEANPKAPVDVTVARDGKEQVLSVLPMATFENNPLERVQRGLLGISAVGRPPLLGVLPGGAAEKAGLQSFDRVFAVDGNPIREELDLRVAIARAGKIVSMEVLRSHLLPIGGAMVVVPEIVAASVPKGEGLAWNAIGIEAADLLAWDVIPGSPAAAAGIRRGDRLLAMDGKPLTSWSAFQIQLRALNRKPFTLTWMSGGIEKQARVSEGLEEHLDDFKNRRQVNELGIRPRAAYLGISDPLAPLVSPERILVTLGPADAAIAAIKTVPEAIGQIARLFAKLFTRDISLESLGGPILLFQVASKSAEAGVDDFLRAMALVSVNLALVNLLPIPILDGFGLLAAGWEGIRRRPIPARAREVANLIGFGVLALLVVLVFKNDITKLFR